LVFLASGSIPNYGERSNVWRRPVATPTAPGPSYPSERSLPAAPLRWAAPCCPSASTPGPSLAAFAPCKRSTANVFANRAALLSGFGSAEAEVRYCSAGRWHRTVARWFRQHASYPDSNDDPAEEAGFEPPVDSLENSTKPALGGAKSGALAPGKPAIDPALAELARLWPTLPKHVRDTIQMLVESCIRGADR